MKKNIFLSFALIGFFQLQAHAQILIPQSSSRANNEQVIGLTNVKVDYARPSIKGRTVFGELVPYGKVWRTGANENTIIQFSTDIKFGDVDVKRGSYALYTLPKADNWEVILYKDTNNWGLAEKWDETKVVARTFAKPESTSRIIENFTIDFNNIDVNGGNLEFAWEKTVVAVKITVPTNEIAMKSIESTLAGPTASDYYESAQYIYQANGDLNKALIWVKKAIDLGQNNSPFWYYRLKALIQSKLGDYRGAIDSANLSLAGAEKANNAEYIKSNTDSIKEWTKNIL